MDWNTITVQQYQSIYAISGEDELTKTVKIICILYGKTEAEVDNMDLLEFNRLSAKCADVLKVEQIPGKAQSHIKVDGKKYHINYKPSSYKFRQYIELQQYAANPIQNMHLIMASIVEPVKGWRRKPNNVEQHDVYAADMLNAKIIDVYHSCVFFCKLYRCLITSGRRFLERNMMTRGMSKQDANELLETLTNTMDGFIPQKEFPIMRA